MKKYRDKMDEIYEDRGASRQDKRKRENQREEKRLKNALRSKTYADIIDEYNEDIFGQTNEGDF